MSARPGQLWVTALLGDVFSICRSTGVLHTFAMGKLCSALCFYPSDLLPPIHVPLHSCVLGMSAAGLLVAVLLLQHS